MNSEHGQTQHICLLSLPSMSTVHCPLSTAHSTTTPKCSQNANTNLRAVFREAGDAVKECSAEKCSAF